MALDLNFLQKANRIKMGEQEAASIVLLDIEKIKPDPNQPRKEFNDEKLLELADDIKKNGLIQPITVKRDNDNYIIITGERRYKAALLNNLKKIEAIIKEDTNNISYIQISENLKRDDLKYYELAEFIIKKVDEGISQVDLSDRLGINKSSLNLFLSWKDAPDLLKKSKTKFNSIRAFSDLVKIYNTNNDKSDVIKKFIEDTDIISTRLVTNLKKSLEDINQDKENIFENESKNEEKEPYKESIDNSFLQSNENEDIDQDKENIFEDKSKNEEKEPYKESIDNSFLQSNENEDIDQDKESIFEDDNKKQQEFKKPIIFGSVDSREATLLFKKIPSTEGFVCVKYEDGFEDEVLAENFKINRICEK